MIPRKSKPNPYLCPVRLTLLLLFLLTTTSQQQTPVKPKIETDNFWIKILEQVGLVETPWKRDLLKNLTRQVKQLIEIENSRFNVSQDKYKTRMVMYEANLKSLKNNQKKSKIDQKKRENAKTKCENKGKTQAYRLKSKKSENLDIELAQLNEFEGFAKALQDDIENHSKAYETKISGLQKKEIRIEAKFNQKVGNYKNQLESLDAEISDLKIKKKELDRESSKIAEKKTDFGLESIKVEEKFDRKCETLLVKLEDLQHDSAPVDAIEISIKRVLKNRPYLEERAKANEKLAGERLKILIKNFKLQKFELKKVKIIHKIRIEKRKEIKKLILKANEYNLSQIKLMEELRNSETEGFKGSEKVDIDTEKIYMERIQTKLKNLRLKEQWTRDTIIKKQKMLKKSNSYSKELKTIFSARAKRKSELKLKLSSLEIRRENAHRRFLENLKAKDWKYWFYGENYIKDLQRVIASKEVSQAKHPFE
jgi:hypothetical protein